MQFETQRLILRPWQPAIDARHAMDIYGDEQVARWVSDGRADTSIRSVQGRLQGYLDNRDQSIVGSWAVEQKDIGRVIGHVLLITLPDLRNTWPTGNLWAELRQHSTEHADVQYPDGKDTHYVEIGWHFRRSSWGFGYATEAALRITSYAFEALKLPILLAVSDPENERSVAVMKRLGMQYDGFTTRYYRGKPLLLYKLSPESAAAARYRQRAKEL